MMDHEGINSDTPRAKLYIVLGVSQSIENNIPK